MTVLQSVYYSFCDENFFDFISIFASDFGNKFFLSFDDFLVLPVSAEFEVDFGFEAGDVDLSLARFGEFLGLFVAHLLPMKYDYKIYSLSKILF